MTIQFVADLARRGDAPALLLEGRAPISYGELASRAARFAERLGPGKCLVAIEAAPSEHAIVAYLATLLGGHAAALLAPGDRAAMDAFIATYEPEAIYRTVDGRWRLDRLDGERPAPHPDLALVLVTSGSTGHGKAVRLSARAVEANARAIATYLGLGPQDRAALVLPLHYCYGLSVLHAHLAAGASVWLAPGSVLDDAFAPKLAAAGCTNLAGVPYTFELLERSGFRDRGPALRFMTVAGGRLEPGAVETWRRHCEGGGGSLYVMYGQTEATARMAYVPPERLAGAADAIGVAIPGGSLSLVDENGRPVTAPNTVGELVYRGPNVMMGYATGRDDLARGQQVDALATGDLARLGDDGLYRIVGRKRRMSKIAGVRIGHDALEAVLAAAGIAAAVVGDDRRLVAAYVSDRDPSDVRGRVAAAAGVTLRHVHAVRLPSFPRLSSGKIDFDALRIHLRDPGREPDGLLEAYRAVFFPRPVGSGDSFASLGGDSLRHVEVAMLLERRLGLVPAGWERRPIADLMALGRTPARHTTFVGVDHVIRALAILLVVIQHETLWPVPGGSAAMMVLIGHGLARFQKDALVAGDFARHFRPLGRVLIPYGAILAGYALVWQRVPWASVLLVSNFGIGDPVDHTKLPFLYWFVEAYAQLLVVFAVLFLIPAVRRLAAVDPFRLGLAILAGGLIARLVGPQAWPLGGQEIFTLPWVFHLAALGWCAATADTPQRRRLVLCLAIAIMPVMAWLGGNWTGSWVKYSLQIVVIAALVAAPRIRLPTPAAVAVLGLAAASYHVYLVHRFVPELLLDPLGGHVAPWVVSVLSIAGGIVLGVGVFRLNAVLLRRFAAARRTGVSLPGMQPADGRTPAKLTC